MTRGVDVGDKVEDFALPDETGTQRKLTELLGEFWVAVLGSGLLPSESTLGIGKV